MIDWKTEARKWEDRAKANAREAARYRVRLRAAEAGAEPPWLGSLLARLDRIEALLDETEWVTDPQSTQQPSTEGTNHE